MHHSKLIKSTILALSISITANAEDKPKSPFPEAVDKALATFCQSVAKKAMPAILTLDDDGNGGVPMRDLTKLLVSRGYGKVSDFKNPHTEVDDRVHKRQMEGMAKIDLLFFRALKPNENEDLNEKCLAKGLESAIKFRLMRSITLDSDKDGKLSLKEYSVSVPVREGQAVDKEGFTEIQRQRFASSDKDKNGFIEGAEYLSQTEFIRNSVFTTMTVLLVDLGDTDNDGTFSKSELRALVPNEEHLPESLLMSDSLHWLRTLQPEQVKEINKSLLAKK